MKTKLSFLALLLISSASALKAQVKTITVWGRAQSAAIIKDSKGKETISVTCDGSYQKEKCYTYTVDSRQTTVSGRSSLPYTKQVTVVLYENGISVASFSGAEVEPSLLGQSATFSLEKATSY